MLGIIFLFLTISSSSQQNEDKNELIFQLSLPSKEIYKTIVRKDRKKPNSWLIEAILSEKIFTDDTSNNKITDRLTNFFKNNDKVVVITTEEFRILSNINVPKRNEIIKNIISAAELAKISPKNLIFYHLTSSDEAYLKMYPTFGSNYTKLRFDNKNIYLTYTDDSPKTDKYRSRFAIANNQTNIFSKTFDCYGFESFETLTNDFLTKEKCIFRSYQYNVYNPCYPTHYRKQNSNELRNYKMCSHKFYKKYATPCYIRIDGFYNREECFSLLTRINQFHHIDETYRPESPIDISMESLIGNGDKSKKPIIVINSPIEVKSIEDLSFKADGACRSYSREGETCFRRLYMLWLLENLNTRYRLLFEKTNPTDSIVNLLGLTKNYTILSDENTKFIKFSSKSKIEIPDIDTKNNAKDSEAVTLGLDSSQNFSNTANNSILTKSKSEDSNIHVAISQINEEEPIVVITDNEIPMTHAAVSESLQTNWYYTEARKTIEIPTTDKTDQESSETNNMDSVYFKAERGISQTPKTIKPPSNANDVTIEASKTISDTKKSNIILIIGLTFGGLLLLLLLLICGTLYITIKEKKKKKRIEGKFLHEDNHL